MACMDDAHGMDDEIDQIFDGMDDADCADDVPFDELVLMSYVSNLVCYWVLRYLHQRT